MKSKKRLYIRFALTVTLFSSLFMAPVVSADTETDFSRQKPQDVRERLGEPKGEDDYREEWKGRMPGRVDRLPVNATYADECSSCHFLYQPWLLPARSWKVLMSNSTDHFGEDLALGQETAKEILEYLVANSTDNAVVRSKWARKIWRSLGGRTPESIRDVPYIKRKHREIRKDVYERPSIKSFSNCGACHRVAAQGDYDDDNVRIPE